MSKLLEKEINKRKTFGIISHPDAGKTTLTEKLLLFGGAIQEAGAVKSNKIKKSATSDFMEIERQRGISVATSVLAFEYRDKKINILDTPGHKDFAEDTYRTLTAVDSVIVVIDVAKGVEEQTEKLVEVCRMRNIPMLVFINKLDREGKDAFDLLDEVEQKLNLSVTPLSWPIGMGERFQGIYSIYEKNIQLFSAQNKQKVSEAIEFEDINNPELDEIIGEEAAETLREELDLIDGVYPAFDSEAYLKGELQPVFFGSALNNFGVKELLDAFIDIAPNPMPKQSDTRLVEPNEDKFTGFVFKIHANMDPKHRDRLAFVKVVSGKFERNKPYLHVRQDKNLKFSSPNAFFADKKEIIDESFPGDIVGLHDTGNFRIGDTLTEGEKLNFKGIPSFSPEHFRYVNNADPMKAKQFEKGIDQLMDEGVAQLFTLEYNNRKIIGTVGALQFEVIEYRLEHEYNAKVSYENINIHKACWVECEDEKSEEFQDFLRVKQKYLARDKYNQLVFLADSAFTIQMTQQKYPSIQLHMVSEF
ncbi:peptide chain release factor 3 [Ornithobacterium rhinotracheale]|uniref:Peptide chain release factor 3 n=2 Tax=Ornithobacterium rhinotracheale TaxID=28251 RepID=I4A2T2_ORNRL|nr:peptide chain release factor 3 [Ornithobacterium rhinotracheale]AFL98266.1 peptide chain release factor 3 [Ornithobacterium rhinotracheale DSM 15997]AIQ00043.1 peptide chain release factor 3 [Ornithobacterium rhinotracheale ORT-UMN 88]KGB66152.1 peptide chain release factor 3 [Ornithobacterium rhinotracheale H06-030791]MCK0193388.1 peptide chain release factor 3 [Ornithobacterium rhinotracheale]MCK0201242.1 peptide chain release factor 3 [Ornithobacterium rhinotracheale]